MKPEDIHIIKKDYGWWKRFRQNRAALWSWYVLIFLIVVSVFSSFIANDQPLYAKYQGKTYYPAWRSTWLAQTVFNLPVIDTVEGEVKGTKEIIRYDISSWKQMKTDNVVWPLVTFSPTALDPYNLDYASPADTQYAPLSDARVHALEGNFRHILGTDGVGRDVFSGLIHGTRISLIIGILSMGVAAFIGILLGALAGYYGNNKLQLNLLGVLLLILSVPLGIFYGFIARSTSITDAFDAGSGTGWISVLAGISIFVLCMILLTFGGNKLGTLLKLRKTHFPLDSIIMRAVEWMNTIPRLLLIIALSAILEERSLFLLVIIIGLTSWTEITRYTRAEFLKVREMDYVTAARAMGLTNFRIIFKHILPNAIAPVIVVIVFGIAAAILTESGLSFLGIGVPDDVVTWGSLLQSGSRETDAWWLIVFPGLAIFITVMLFNLIGEGLRDAMDPKVETLGKKEKRRRKREKLKEM